MLSYIVKRLLVLLLVVFGASVIIFVMSHSLPGDPATAIIGFDTTPEQVRQVTEKYHLDEPMFVQYFIWAKMALYGDFGKSIYYNSPVLHLLFSRLPVTLELALLSMIISIGIALPAGILSAVKKDTWIDNLARVYAFVGVSLPNFWLGIMLMLLFGVIWRVLPLFGYVSFQVNPLSALAHLILPAVTLGTSLAALVTRMTRSCLLEELNMDYVTVARARGLRETVVIWKHALRNAMIPIVTVVGLQFGYLLGGSVITETIFSLPGLGKLIIDSIFFRDYPVVQGAILIYTIMFSLVNLLVDFSYSLLDPRVRYG